MPDTATARIWTAGDTCYCGLYPEHTHQDHAERGPFLDGDRYALTS